MHVQVITLSHRVRLGRFYLHEASCVDHGMKFHETGKNTGRVFFWAHASCMHNLIEAGIYITCMHRLGAWEIKMWSGWGIHGHTCTCRQQLNSRGVTFIACTCSTRIKGLSPAPAVSWGAVFRQESRCQFHQFSVVDSRDTCHIYMYPHE